MSPGPLGAPDLGPAFPGCAAPARAADTPALSHPSVLIVDDEPRLLDAMFALLSLEGYRLRRAGSGREALARMAESHFDAVLLDLNLPDMSGLQIMDGIAAMGQAPGIVVVSGDTHIEAAIGALRHGAHDFLRKPYRPPDLLASVAKAVHRSTLERQNALMRMQLAESEHLHRALVEASPDLIAMLDGRHRFVFANERCATLLGIERNTLIGSDIATLLHPEERERVAYVLQEGGHHAHSRTLELRLSSRRHDNAWRLFEVTLVPLAETDLSIGRAWYVVARDVTERHEAQATIAYRAFHDVLTDLPNRMLFNDRLGLALMQARRAGRELAVMFVDLDRFKIVNDTLGHSLGDDLLKQVADRMRGCLRRGDTLARVGGDEFLVLLPDVASQRDAEFVADKMVQQLATPFVLAGTEVFISSSIGIAQYPAHGDRAEVLVGAADAAMYQTKAEGKNGYRFFEPAMHSAAHRALTLQGEILRGLQAGEFDMYYQPQIDAQSGRLIGAEALVRWHHPERGLLSAGEFIPFAEEVGIIHELSDWLIDHVFADMQQWLSAGMNVPRIGINISPQYLEREDFAERILNGIATWRIPPELVELEITETVCIRNPDALGARLMQLSQHGLLITIDDFGVRYSSLAYLQALPVDKIKIDQSFVRPLGRQAGLSRAVTAILAIARNLGLHVVAEGVEEGLQRDALLEAGCPCMQGYLFSRAIPTGEFVPLMLAQTATAPSDSPLLG